jgi:hypothetical protein
MRHDKLGNTKLVVPLFRRAELLNHRRAQEQSLPREEQVRDDVCVC